MLAERQPSGARILVIEDDEEIAQFIKLELSYEGYEVEVAHDGMKGLIAARQQPPDLVILDLMLPAVDGMEVCRRLRQTSETPILMLTAKGDVRDRVAGLDAGASDYLAKPFDLDELLARVRVQLRDRAATRQDFRVADLALNPSTREVRRGERAIELSPKEFELLHYLIRNARQVMTRDRLLEEVWGYDFGGDSNILEVYIRYLRNKIEDETLPKLIHTVRGVGYVLRESP
ncbi:MAG: response regulator transcription factor [Cyanobacteria bacterium REEB65]|nr:response regulator transcription factor [Cyanobacteria bacterium REEB65]